jgi:hypothetical protein
VPRFNLDDYVDVNSRIDLFWDKHPEGAITTKLVAHTPDLASVIVEAAVYRHRDSLTPDATGLAQEHAGGVGPNQTSWVENCETSAIGRALANLGFETSKQRPSRQEMEKVNRGQIPPQGPKPAPPATNGAKAAAGPHSVIWTAFRATKRPEEELRIILRSVTGQESSKEVKPADVRVVLAAIGALHNPGQGIGLPPAEAERAMRAVEEVALTAYEKEQAEMQQATIVDVASGEIVQAGADQWAR